MFLYIFISINKNAFFKFIVQEIKLIYTDFYLKIHTNKQLFLDTNMDAGHGGASGRFEALKELAKEFTFLLDLEKIKK